MVSTPRPNRFVLSNLSSPLMPCRDLVRVGSTRPFSGLDLDTQQVGRFRLQRWSTITDCAGSAVASYWVAPHQIDRLLPRLEHHINDRGGSIPRVLIDSASATQPLDEKDQLTAAIRLRMQFDEAIRVALVVRPYRTANTRSHLNAISALGLHASEWDIDLALDLSKQIDWLWEAEAAVHRLMPSLRSIRLSFPTQTFDGRFRTSLTQRAVNAAAEMGFVGTISLVIPLPFWHWRNATALEASAREAALSIGDQFVRRQMPDVFSPGQMSIFRDQ